jgi:lipopolysaccharide export system permease protein
MNRASLHLAFRLLASIGFVCAVMIGLFGLIEFIGAVSRDRSVAPADLAWSAAAALVQACVLVLETLPVYVLVGAIVAIVDLQRRQEMVVMKAAGASIWRLLQAPVAITLFGGIFAFLALDPAILAARHAIESLRAGPGAGESGWLFHQTEQGRYFIHAGSISAQPPALGAVSVFAYDETGLPQSQITAETARLQADRWLLADGIRSDVASAPVPFEELALGAGVGTAEIELALGSASGMNFFQLWNLLQARNLEDSARSVAQMRLSRLAALPLVLAGSLLIAFAFTAGYRRQGTSGVTILYAILLGFVVFVATRLVEQAGSAGIVNPSIAAWGPAIVATVIGVTALLYLEDG